MGERRPTVPTVVVVFVSALAIAVAVGGMASASTIGVPQAMVGCWHRHVPAVPGLTAAGIWHMKITRSGKLSTFVPGTTSCGRYADFSTSASVAGQRLTIGAVPVCGTNGVYSWHASATALTVKTVADAQCSP